MPVAAPLKSGRIRFDAEQGLDAAYDLAGVVAGATQQCWDLPSYSKVLSVFVADGSHMSHWTAPPTNVTFTVGAALAPTFTGRVLTLGQGFFGVVERALTVNVPSMLWSQLDAPVVLEHSINTDPSRPRYDVVYVDVTEANEEELTRHFTDGVTDAKTTWVGNKRRSVQATFGVVEGAPGGAIPDVGITASRRAVCVVRVAANGGDIDFLADATVPFGAAEISNPPPARDALYTTGQFTNDWGVLKGDTASPGANVYMPAPFFGDPTARLLGLRLHFQLKAGSFARLVKLTYTATTPVVSTIDSIPIVTPEPIEERQDLFPLPGPGLGGTIGPFWGHGERVKTAVPPSAKTGLALHIRAAKGAGDYVAGVTWIWAKA